MQGVPQDQGPRHPSSGTDCLSKVKVTFQLLGCEGLSTMPRKTHNSTAQPAALRAVCCGELLGAGSRGQRRQASEPSSTSHRAVLGQGADWGQEQEAGTGTSHDTRPQFPRPCREASGLQLHKTIPGLQRAGCHLVLPSVGSLTPLEAERAPLGFLSYSCPLGWVGSGPHEPMSNWPASWKGPHPPLGSQGPSRERPDVKPHCCCGLP